MKFKVAAALIAVSVTTGYVFWVRSTSGESGSAAAAISTNAQPAKDFASVQLPGDTAKRFDLPSRNSSPVPGSVSNVDPSVAEKLEGITRNVESTFRKAMKGLGLSTNEISELRNYLISRAAAGYIARDVSVKQGAAAWQTIQSADRARAEIDQEIRVRFGEEKFARIRSMHESRVYLDLEERELVPLFEKAGVAQLSPEQLLKFAESMAETNGKDISVIPPLWKDPTTNLTNRDVPVLERALTYMSPEQISVLKEFLAQRNNPAPQR